MTGPVPCLAAKAGLRPAFFYPPILTELYLSLTLIPYKPYIAMVRFTCSQAGTEYKG